MTGTHIPVLPAEAMEYLGIKQGDAGVWVDATLGLGGHSEAILKLLGTQGRLVALDRDAESMELAKERLKGYPNFTAIKANFSEMAEVLEKLEIKEINGVLYDFGVSSLHFDEAGRGFSFAKEASLDMRMDRESRLTADTVVNSYRQEELERVIRDFGEDYRYRTIAGAIIRNRPVKTTTELAEIIKKAKHEKPGRTHPATKVFQAIRMEVNDELGEIRAGLEAALKAVKPGGRIVTITFHSLEDRLVKQFFNREASDCVCENKRMPCICGHKASLNVLTKKPVEAGEKDLGKSQGEKREIKSGGEDIEQSQVACPKSQVKT